MSDPRERIESLYGATLAVGARIGVYEIVAPIGAGGMGEVYRAHDPRLGRDVAIKVLPQSFAGDPDRRARFEREARLLAALNHPNIAHIHGLETSNGILGLVMELFEGETLRDRLTRGRVPVRKAVDIAAQIARGLAAAHDKGVVHRDLKPENVFLLTDGHVKILDFGLARQTVAAVGSGATETAAVATDPGTVLGTVGYMAPEQVRGQSVDARADLFALGAVLYEMLTGYRAFQGTTAADTMTAILREEPPELSGVRGEALAGLDRVTRHCLEKDPAERFQNARDVAFALQAFSGTSAGSTSGAVSALRARRSRAAWLAVGAMVVAALSAGVLVGRALRPVPAPITYEAKTSEEQYIMNARFAPDGQTIVYSATRYGDEHHPRLYAIRPGELTSQPVGGPGMHLLSVSSKGELAVLTNPRQDVGVVWRGTLARMTLDGAPRPWLDDVMEADWSPDASTAAITRRVGNAIRLEYPVGHPLYELTHGYLSDPRVSPDGTRVAFVEHPIAGNLRGWVKVTGASGAPRTLTGEVSGLHGLAWSGDGRSVYFSGEMPGTEGHQLLVVNADGSPKPHLAVATAGDMAVLDVAHNGAVLLMSIDFRWSIRALVPGEVRERELSWLGSVYSGFLSSDAKALIFGDHSDSAGNNSAVALQDLATSRITRLGEGAPLGLSPDNKHVAALIPSVEQIVVYPIGPGDPIKLPKGPLEHYEAFLQWFPNSQRVLVCGNEAGQAPRCYEQDLAGGLPRPVTSGGVVAAFLANDGRTLLVLKADSTYDVTMVGEPSGRAAQGLTQDDGVIGWASNGRDLVVEEGDHEPARVMQVDPSTGARRFLRSIGPPDPNGSIGVNQWIADGGAIRTPTL